MKYSISIYACKDACFSSNQYKCKNQGDRDKVSQPGASDVELEAEPQSEEDNNEPVDVVNIDNTVSDTELAGPSNANPPAAVDDKAAKANNDQGDQQEGRYFSCENFLSNSLFQVL